MKQSKTPAGAAQGQGPTYYGPDDDLPPGATQALKRRTAEELRQAADRATRRS